jgi:hypothetical protein
MRRAEMPGFFICKNIGISKEIFKTLLTYHSMGGIIKTVKGT